MRRADSAYWTQRKPQRTKKAVSLGYNPIWWMVIFTG